MYLLWFRAAKESDTARRNIQYEVSSLGHAPLSSLGMLVSRLFPELFFLVMFLAQAVFPGWEKGERKVTKDIQ